MHAQGLNTLGRDFFFTFLRKKKNVLDPVGLCDENNADNVPMERWKMRM